MFPNTVTSSKVSENSTKEILESFVHQLEIQKKVTTMFAIRGLQEYINQVTQFSMFQETLRAQIIELHKALNPNCPNTQQMSPPKRRDFYDEQDYMKRNLQKLIEESFSQSPQKNSETRSANVSSKTIDEASTGKNLYDSKSLEALLSESMLREYTKKAFESANHVKNRAGPWKCEHQTQFARGFCQECFYRVKHQKKIIGKTPSSNGLVSMSQQMGNGVKFTLKKRDTPSAQNQFRTSPTIPGRSAGTVAGVKMEN